MFAYHYDQIMITHHYDHSSSQNLLGTKWSNYDQIFPLFAVTCTIINSEKVESRTQNRCTLLHRPLLSKHCHNSNTNTFGLGIPNNMQCASRDLQSASRFSINFKFCLKKVSFHQNDQIMIVPKLLKNFAHHYDQIMITHHYDHLVSPAFRMDKIGHYDRSF